MAEAETISRTVVEERLAACANIIGEIRSFYQWEEQVQEGQEVGIFLKSRSELIDALTARVRQIHSYECPCIVAVPIEGGNPDYLAWISTETRHPRD